jgi:pimeloyl-ACP methyl ester carboxylesterase
MTSINRSDKISENQIKIDGLNINYKTIGNGEIPIVLLHGWGTSSDKYLELAKTYARRRHVDVSSSKNKFKILIPDLPGFGKSDEPKENWELDDYIEFTNKFIENATREKKGFELVKDLLKKFDSTKTARVEEKVKPILIGHSFGGRIAIKYAVKYPEKINKLILTGAAGIRHKLTSKQKLLFILTKIGKITFSLPIINFFQSPIYKIFSKIVRGRKKDYYKATPKMKEIMKNVLVEDLTDYFDKIKIPTLLVWGREDKTTSLIDGEIMNEKIKDSKLIVVDNANHSLPYQKPKEFARIVEEFIKK